MQQSSNTNAAGIGEVAAQLAVTLLRPRIQIEAGNSDETAFSRLNDQFAQAANLIPRLHAERLWWAGLHAERLDSPEAIELLQQAQDALSLTSKTQNDKSKNDGDHSVPLDRLELNLAELIKASLERVRNESDQLVNRPPSVARSWYHGGQNPPRIQFPTNPVVRDWQGFVVPPLLTDSGMIGYRDGLLTYWENSHATDGDHLGDIIWRRQGHVDDTPLMGVRFVQPGPNNGLLD